MIASEDRAEGIAAFNEKRDPELEEPVTPPTPFGSARSGPATGSRARRRDVPTDEEDPAHRRADRDRVASTSKPFRSFRPRRSRRWPTLRDVWQRDQAPSGVFYSALVPNRKGAEIAAEVGVDGLQVFIAASDSYNLRNVGRLSRIRIADVASVVEVGKRRGLPVEGTISCAFG